MDDILASIRRILAEDEHAKPAPDPQAPTLSHHSATTGAEVLDLHPSMIVEEPAMPTPEPAHHFEPAPVQPPASAAEAYMPPAPVRDDPPPPSPEPLVAPEAAAAATASVGTLVRHLAAERSIAVTRQGPSLEDVIRDEIRPLLKGWLDANLPPMVERLVRAEIARVVDRSLS